MFASRGRSTRRWKLKPKRQARSWAAQYCEVTKLADRRGSRRELMSGHTKSAPGGALWAVVLAGGQGIRLLPLVRELYGDERPKQFARIVGTKSLLRQTLDR